MIGTLNNANGLPIFILSSLTDSNLKLFLLQINKVKLMRFHLSKKCSA